MWDGICSSYTIEGLIYLIIMTEKTFFYESRLPECFNECRRLPFLSCLKQVFLEVFLWVQWSYHTAGELHFGNFYILSTAGVQQGDPLGPLLISLVVSQFFDGFWGKLDLELQLWYLDDGTFVGTCKSVSELLQSFGVNGHTFGLHLNLDK